MRANEWICMCLCSSHFLSDVLMLYIGFSVLITHKHKLCCFFKHNRLWLSQRVTFSVSQIFNNASGYLYTATQDSLTNTLVWLQRIKVSLSGWTAKAFCLMSNGLMEVFCYLLSWCRLALCYILKLLTLFLIYHANWFLFGHNMLRGSLEIHACGDISTNWYCIASCTFRLKMSNELLKR